MKKPPPAKPLKAASQVRHFEQHRAILSPPRFLPSPTNPLPLLRK